MTIGSKHKEGRRGHKNQERISSTNGDGNTQQEDTGNKWGYGRQEGSMERGREEHGEEKRGTRGRRGEQEGEEGNIMIKGGPCGQATNMESRKGVRGNIGE